MGDFAFKPNKAKGKHMNADIQLAVNALPDLEQANESLISFTPEYLDIDALEKGWSKRCFYLGIEEREQIDEATGESKLLKCAMLAAQNADKSITVYESAAKTLVGTLEEREKRGLLKPNVSAIKLTFLGKKKNKTNQYSSAKWDIRLLHINQPEAA